MSRQRNATPQMWRLRLSRRGVLAAACGVWATGISRRSQAVEAVSFGLTPVLLDSDVHLLALLRRYLETRLDRPVSLVTRRTYQEISALLLSGQLDAAWICGFPYIQYQDRLALLAVPIYRGEPLYQSYLIINRRLLATSVDDLRGSVHAFSDPDSNSGFLVTRHLLATMNESPDTFFRRTFFTYGHRNVIRAVGSGLAQSGSVDGYIWEVVGQREPALVRETAVLRKSEKLGFPPIACNARHRDTEIAGAIAKALQTMPDYPLGQDILRELDLDGFSPGQASLFDGIAEKYRYVRAHG